MVVSEPFGERLLNWLQFRKKTVREGGLFHELNQVSLPTEAIEEVAEKVKEKNRGYRDG
jgi:hypothetical protein